MSMVVNQRLDRRVDVELPSELQKGGSAMQLVAGGLGRKFIIRFMTTIQVQWQPILVPRYFSIARKLEQYASDYKFASHSRDNIRANKGIRLIVTTKL